MENEYVRTQSGKDPVRMPPDFQEDPEKTQLDPKEIYDTIVDGVTSFDNLVKQIAGPNFSFLVGREEYWELLEDEVLVCRGEGIEKFFENIDKYINITK